MRLLNLAADCRAAGLTVVELDGWQQRGADLAAVGAVLAHHTATDNRTSDAAVDRLLRDGRSDLPGPLAQVGLDRAGRVRIIAAGRANHAGTGGWQGVTGNSRAVGVEAYNDGRGEPWPQVQLDAWDVLNAVLLRTIRQAADRLCGHKEWAPTRKIDPYGLDMNAMRRRAAACLHSTTEDEVTPDDVRNIAAAVWAHPLKHRDIDAPAVVVAVDTLTIAQQSGSAIGQLLSRPGANAEEVAAAITDELGPEFARKVVDALSARLAPAEGAQA